MLFLSENWVIDNLNHALNTWNDKLSEIFQLIGQSPSTFKDGSIWKVILNINGVLQAIGLSLLVLFFVVGMLRTCGSITEVKRPEQVLKLFIRFAIAKVLVSEGLDIMLKIFEIVQGITMTIMKTAGISGTTKSVLPNDIVIAINNTSFLKSIPLWSVTLIGGLVITVLSFIMILTVYGRFFKLYLYTAIAPIPLSSLAGEHTQNIGISFIKSYCAVCLEGVIIVLACVIFTLFASSPPVVDSNVAAATQVWKYLAELIFNMLVLVGTIKMSDRVVKEMMGL